MLKDKKNFYILIKMKIKNLDYFFYIIAIIAGIIIGIANIPFLSYVMSYIVNVTAQGPVELFENIGQVLIMATPTVISIGLILYGITEILREKSIITDKSDKILKIISHVFLYIGLGFLIFSFISPILFQIFPTLPFQILPIIALLTFFLLCIGFCIPSKSKRKNKDMESI